MNKRLPFLLLFLLCLTLTACAPKTEFDIRGEWQYTMIDSSGNTYDSGTITFSGTPEKGTYLQINIYDVAYEGAFTVKGSDIQLSGYETWGGTVLDVNTINGNWEHDDGANGTFQANR